MFRRRTLGLLFAFLFIGKTLPKTVKRHFWGRWKGFDLAVYEMVAPVYRSFRACSKSADQQKPLAGG
jgi:hypothetical protein